MPWPFLPTVVRSPPAARTGRSESGTRTTGDSVLLWPAMPPECGTSRFPPTAVRSPRPAARITARTAAEVKIWDIISGKPPANLQGHTSLVTAVVFFPNGRRIATASDDRTIKVWDVATREDVFTLRGHTSGVVSLAISPNGQQLVSGSIDYSAKTWSAETYPEDVAFEISRRRAAVERVGSLFSQHLLKADVLAALRANASLSPTHASRGARDRRAAGRKRFGPLRDCVADDRPSQAARSKPTGRLRDSSRPLAALSATIPSDSRSIAAPWRWLITAPAKPPRRSKPSTASTYRLPVRTPAKPAAPIPLDLAIVAMARSKLHQAAAAQSALEELRKLLKTDRWVNDREAQGFLKEAEDVLNSPAR